VAVLNTWARAISFRKHWLSPITFFGRMCTLHVHSPPEFLAQPDPSTTVSPPHADDTSTRYYEHSRDARITHTFIYQYYGPCLWTAVGKSHVYLLLSYKISLGLLCNIAQRGIPMCVVAWLITRSSWSQAMILFYFWM
jgi:hypothetical protein